jgi:hypothetical protein
MSNRTRALSAAAIAAVTASACFQLGAAYREHMFELCANPQRAYEYGYNRGLERHAMDTVWIDRECAFEQRESARDSYLAGYDAGIARAPATVVQVDDTRPRARHRAGGADECTFGSDCGEDMSCRRWSGHNVCMGYGGWGAPCVFGSDCLSNRCRLPHGGGIDKVCD